MVESNKSMRDILKEMLDGEELVNLTLVTEDGGQFKVHFEVLYANSLYIKRLADGSDDILGSNVTIPGVSKHILKKIIHCIYTGELVIDDGNMQSLTDAARQLGVPEVIQLCDSNLKENLTVDNCFGRFFLSNRNGCNELKEVVKKFIISNFEKLHSRDEYCNLEIDDLKSILSCDSLNVKTEESVYYAAMKWLEKDQINRTSYLPDLLLCVRVGLCDYAFVNEQILPNPLIADSEECEGFLYQTSELFSDLQQTNGDHASATFYAQHPFLRPRVPHEIIFVMGGWSAGSATNCMETYDCKTKMWFLTHADNFSRAYHGMVWHKGKIYIIGGFDGQQCFNSVRSFDPVSHEWKERACMHVQRCYVSCATVGDFVYAMGGYDGHRRHRTCERFEPDTNQWTLVASMNAVRSDASADAHDGKIYIAGGFNGTQVLDTVEVYDPDTNQWTLINHNMLSPRSGVKMAAYRNHIYVIGGFNGSSRLASVERYDITTRVWQYVSTMLGPRSNFATAIVNDCIYVVGGFNGLSTIASAEMYDPSTNVWRAVTDLNLNRSALAACKVSDIPTAHEYSFLGMYN